MQKKHVKPEDANVLNEIRMKESRKKFEQLEIWFGKTEKGSI